MKNALALSLALLATLALGLWPGIARAVPIHDCTNGCEIVTCQGSLCTLWRCDANGCRFVTAYDRDVKPKSHGSQRGKPVAVVDEVDYVRICPVGKGCQLYEVTAREALLLGTFDNLDDIVSYRQQMRAAPSPASPAPSTPAQDRR